MSSRGWALAARRARPESTPRSTGTIGWTSGRVVRLRGGIGPPAGTGRAVGPSPRRGRNGLALVWKRRPGKPLNPFRAAGRPLRWTPALSDGQTTESGRPPRARDHPACVSRQCRAPASPGTRCQDWAPPDACRLRADPSPALRIGWCHGASLTPVTFPESRAWTRWPVWAKCRPGLASH